MAEIEDYLRLLDLPYGLELQGERASLTDFDGVSVPVETGDREFYEWRLREQEDGYCVVLSQDTPGEVIEVGLEGFADKLESREYVPTARSNDRYLLGDHV